MRLPPCIIFVETHKANETRLTRAAEFYDEHPLRPVDFIFEAEDVLHQGVIKGLSHYSKTTSSTVTRLR